MEEQRVHAARVAALYALATPAYLTTVVLGAILVGTLWVPYANALLLGWLAVLVVVTALRALVHWRYAGDPDRDAGARAWENRFALGAVASGAVWAFAATVFFPHGDPVLQVAVVLIVGGTTLGAVGLFAPSARAVYGFGVLPFGAILAQLLAQPAPTYHLLALCVVLFGAVVARIAYQQRSHVVEITRAKVRNEELLARANASENQLRDAIASFPEGIAIWSPADRLVVSNERYAGLPRDTLGADNQERPYEYQTRDGRWLHRSSTRMPDGGRVELVADVTALKRAQESYLKVLAEEQIVLDTLPVGVAFVEHRRIVRCNRRLEQMLGYAPGELHGQPTRAWFSSDERWTEAGRYVYERMRDGGAVESEARLRRKDGSRLWCQVLGRPLDRRSPESSAIFAFADAEARVAAEQALKRSEQMYRNLVETSGELIWSVDTELRWTYLNPGAARRIYGRDPGEMLGRRIDEFAARELQERDHAVFRRVLGGEAVFAHETRHTRRDGGYVELAFNAIALRDGAGAITGVTGTARDVTEEKRTLAALQESVARLRLAVEAADLYYWEWDARTDRLYWGRDPGLVLPAGEGRPQTWSEYAAIVHSEDRERYLACLRDATGRMEPFELEYRVTGPDGRVRWFSSRGVPIAASSSTLARMTGVAQDITETKRREDAVRFMAYHDALTGLPNRRLLDDRLRQLLPQAQRRGRHVAAMLVDLDNFKQVNDSAGHRAGDAVLREVAQRLSSCVRRSDTVARHGGDEFIIVLPEVHGEADCRTVAEKVLAALGEPFTVDGRQYALGASIGVSLFPSDAGDGDALLRNADASMYKAKQNGKNRYRFYGR